MDVLDAIRSRRMLPRVRPERPRREEVAELLELAVRAPNHHLTNPWRFHVLTGAGLDRLAAAMAEASDLPPQEAMEDARRRVSRAPVIVAVTCVPSRREGVVEQEELAAVAMAIQNMLLAAHARGLGAMLRTGPVAYHPAVRRHLGLGEDEQVVGFVYLGYPAADRQPTPREPASALTRWVGWEEPDEG
jgi:nitroreductase